MGGMIDTRLTQLPTSAHYTAEASVFHRFSPTSNPASTCFGVLTCIYFIVRFSRDPIIISFKGIARITAIEMRCYRRLLGIIRSASGSCRSKETPTVWPPPGGRVRLHMLRHMV